MSQQQTPTATSPTTQLSISSKQQRRNQQHVMTSYLQSKMRLNALSSPSRKESHSACGIYPPLSCAASPIKTPKPFTTYSHTYKDLHEQSTIQPENDLAWQSNSLLFSQHTGYSTNRNRVHSNNSNVNNNATSMLAPLQLMPFQQFQQSIDVCTPPSKSIRPRSVKQQQSHHLHQQPRSSREISFSVDNISSNSTTSSSKSLLLSRIEDSCEMFYGDREFISPMYIASPHLQRRGATRQLEKRSTQSSESGGIISAVPTSTTSVVPLNSLLLYKNQHPQQPITSKQAIYSSRGKRTNPINPQLAELDKQPSHEILPSMQLSSNDEPSQPNSIPKIPGDLIENESKKQQLLPQISQQQRPKVIVLIKRSRQHILSNA